MNVTFILGTRPEVIKLAPVVREARLSGWKTRVVHTGQHMELTEPLVRFFGLRENANEFINLEAMLEKPSLTRLSSRVLERMEEKLAGIDTDFIVVQGDTTSAFVGAYWAFCRRIPVAHVEAGLRTGDLSSPFPEEANRVLIGRLADLHFAPTSQAMRSLMKEGSPSSRVFMTGNTAIDALKLTLDAIAAGKLASEDRLPEEIVRFTSGGHRVVLVTTHRRENLGEPLSRICSALRSICDADSRVRMILPVRPNPNVRAQIGGELGRHPQIMLCEPISYVPFVQLMSRADLLITDSGGVQEEGPTLRKPILVIRESTERPEGVEAGFAKLVGSDPRLIFQEAQNAFANGVMTERENPYGDGRASQRIMASLRLAKESSLACGAPQVRVSSDVTTIRPIHSPSRTEVRFESRGASQALPAIANDSLPLGEQMTSRP